MEQHRGGFDSRCFLYIIGLGNPSSLSSFLSSWPGFVEDAIACVCLIAPAWPTQVWYPQLLSMLADLPVLLPDYNDLLLSSDHNPHGRESTPDRLACLRKLYEIYSFILFILLLCKTHVEYKNTDNDWNHIRPASLDLN